MRKNLLPCALSLAVAATASAVQPAYQPSEAILQAREEFRDKGFGIFIHWGIYSMLGSGEWVLNDPNIFHHEYKDLPEASTLLSLTQQNGYLPLRKAEPNTCVSPHATMTGSQCLTQPILIMT